MIVRYDKEQPTLTQREWLDYVDGCFCHVFHWTFASPIPDGDDNERAHELPNLDMLRKVDPMLILSMGQERLMDQEVDRDKAFKPMDRDYADESEQVSQDVYDQAERMIALANIWGSHTENRWSADPMFLPRPGWTAEGLREKAWAYAREAGIDYEVKAYLDGVPLDDVLAQEAGTVYRYTDWNVSFDLK